MQNAGQEFTPEQIEEYDKELEGLIDFWIKNRQQMAFAFNVDELDCVNGRIIGIKKKLKKGELKVEIKTLKEMIG